jgi:hypothetical protein
MGLPFEAHVGAVAVLVVMPIKGSETELQRSKGRPVVRRAKSEFYRSNGFSCAGKVAPRYSDSVIGVLEISYVGLVRLHSVDRRYRGNYS